jgi:chemotaxis protein MotB
MSRAKAPIHDDHENIISLDQHKLKKKIVRKKPHGGGHHETVHEGEGPWIVSYADMMTLLFCFFVIMCSFANFDPVVVAKRSAAVADHFAPDQVSEDLKSFQTLGTDIGGHPNLKGVARSTLKDGTLEIVFSSSLMFESGEVDISPQFFKSLDVLIGLIKNKNPSYRIIVEGHTDNSPMSTKNHYRNNWELSSARAASVVSRFIYFGFKPTQLVAVGFGDSRPIVEDHDKSGEAEPENQALNRRVVIKVLKPMKSAKMKNLGIDTYFDDSEITK